MHSILEFEFYRYCLGVFVSIEFDLCQFLPYLYGKDFK